jgi:hypothetical protein
MIIGNSTGNLGILALRGKPISALNSQNGAHQYCDGEGQH